MSPDAEETLTRLVNEVFLCAAALRRAGDELAAPHGLTSSRWLILGALADGPLRIVDIGRRRGLTRQSARESIDRLVRDGLAARRDNPDDARGPLLTLTPAGRSALADIEPRRAHWATEVASRVEHEQLSTALRSLESLRAALVATS